MFKIPIASAVVGSSPYHYKINILIIIIWAQRRITFSESITTFSFRKSGRKFFCIIFLKVTIPYSIIAI